MMSRSKKLCFLCGGLVAAVLVYIVAVSFGGEKEKVDDITFINVSADDVEKLQWEYSGEEIKLEKTENGWIWTTDENYPIKQETVEKMVSLLTETKANSRLIDASPSEYGINEEKASIKMLMNDGGEISLYIGDRNDIVSKCYVKVEGDDCIYLVNTTFASGFNYSLDDLLQTEEIEHISDINEISITVGDDNIQLTATDTESGELEWSCGEVVLSADKVDKLTDSLNGIAWKECVEYNAETEQLSEYGFDIPTAAVRWSNGEQTVELELGAYADTSGIYARLADSSMIYTVEEDIMNYLICDYTAYADEEE